MNSSSILLPNELLLLELSIDLETFSKKISVSFIWFKLRLSVLRLLPIDQLLSEI